VKHNATGLVQGFECLNDRHHLHSVVGRVVLTARQLFLVVVTL
jgi:hypothetical protein